MSFGMDEDRMYKIKMLESGGTLEKNVVSEEISKFNDDISWHRRALISPLA